MGVRILIIEADPDLNRLLHVLLETDGYEVTTTFATDAALARARRETFDLIIYDWDLDDLRGQLLLDTLVTELPLHTIPLLLICGRAPAASIANALGMSGTPMIEKPFDLRLFTRQVAALVHPRERAVGAAVL